MIKIDEIVLSQDAPLSTRVAWAHPVEGDKIELLVYNNGEWCKTSSEEVDLSDYQLKVDEALQTDDKTIVGAINEIFNTPSGVGRIDETSDGTGEKFNVSSGTVASGAFSLAENEGAKATGKGSHSEGYKCLASGEYSHAEGYFCEASGNESHAEGQGTIASGIYSHAEGWQTRATNSNEHAGGAYNQSNTGETPESKTRMSVGIGESDGNRKNALEVMANGDVYVYGVGDYHGNNATSDESKPIQEIIGSGPDPQDQVGKVDPNSDGTGEIFNDYTSNHAEGNCSHAEGSSTTANNSYEHACGFMNVSHSEENHKTRFSIGIGDKTTVPERTNAVEVMQNGDVYIYDVNGYDGINVGAGQSLQYFLKNKVGVGKRYNDNGGEIFNSSSNIASGNYSHAEGNNSQATGVQSHAENISTASGSNSHAENAGTAEGSYSHAEGYRTIASNMAEHAEGEYNISHKSGLLKGVTLHSVGIGDSSSRKNAHEIMKNGDHYIYGIGGYDGTEIKSNTNGIKTLQDVITDLQNRIAALEQNSQNGN